MKLILDAQLPVKLSEILSDIEMDSIHVEQLPKGDETPDWEIINYADLHDIFVCTKDTDFYHSHMALGKPKKLLLITTGNIKNKKLFDLFRKYASLIKTALEFSSFIELSNEGIIEHN